MKPKGMLFAMLGKGDGKSDSSEEEAPPSSRREGGEADDERAEELAGEFYDALGAKDRPAAVNAILSLIYHCQE